MEKKITNSEPSDWKSFIEPISNRLLDLSKRNPLYNLDKNNTILVSDELISEETKSLHLNLDKKLLKIINQVIKV